MLESNLNYINATTEKKYKKNLVSYFFFSILIALLETFGVGLIPGVLAILLDKNIVLEKIKFNQDLYIFIFNLFQSEQIYIYIAITIFLFFSIKIVINLIFTLS